MEDRRQILHLLLLLTHYGKQAIWGLVGCGIPRDTHQRSKNARFVVGCIGQITEVLLEGLLGDLRDL